MPRRLLTMTRLYELTEPVSGPSALSTPMTGPSVPQPWGFWGTLGFLLLAAAAGLIASLGVVIVWVLAKAVFPNLNDAVFAVIGSVAATLASLKVFDLAVKAREWRVRDYLAHTTPPARRASTATDQITA